MNLSLILAIIIIASIVVGVFSSWYFYNLFSAPKSKAVNSATNQKTTTAVVSAMNDNTKKCISAGGVCTANCQTTLTGSTTGNFLENIFIWFRRLFTPTNSSVLEGSVIDSSDMQEIGSYPNYCTARLPKCCKTSSVASSTTTTTSTTTFTTSNTITTTSILSQSLDTAINALDNELGSALNESLTDLENSLLQT
jgi:hypothetical protein